jgi:hypothetical protein
MTSTHGDNHTGKTRAASVLLIAGIVFALLLAGTGVTAYLLVVKAPADLARRTAEGIREVFDFTPRVTLNETVLIAENTPILEVATVSRSLVVHHRWSHTWLGSTKTLELHGSFTAKAGFDLHEPFTIDIERSPLRVVARMPAPKLLSVQMDSFVVVADENGWWNRITEEDRTEAVRTLQARARGQSEASGILLEARRSAEDRIREVVQRNGDVVLFPPPEIP